MSNKSAAPRKTSIPSKNDQKARLAELEAMRRRNQNILLTIVGVVILVAVIGIIFLSSRAPEAEVKLDEINKKLADIKFGTTKEGEYPLIFPTMGDPNAPVRMEEISSFACPACMGYHSTILTNLYDKIRAGQLYYVYMPTTRTGDYTPEGKYLVTAAGYCAVQQNKFWPMHELLWDWQAKYGADTPARARLIEGANKLGLDTGKFSACLDAKETRTYIDASDTYVSEKRQMASTPSIFLFVDGKQLEPPPDKASNTPLSMNGLDLGSLRGIIEARVAAAQTTVAPTTAATAAATTAPTTEPTTAAATTAATVAPTTEPTAAPTAAK
jgi:protein-disulfide isomerase